MKIKRFAQIICTVLLLTFLVIPQPVNAEIQQDWTIEGNTVYIDDSNVYIAATPHTITSSGWVEFELRSKGYEGEIDAVWGFDILGGIKPSQPQIWRENVAHEAYNLVDKDDNEATIAITNITSFTKLLWVELEGEPDIGNRTNLHLYSITGIFDFGYPEEEAEVQTLTAAFNSHTLEGNAGTITYFYTTQEREYYTAYYDDWVNFSVGTFSKVYYPYKGCNDWHFTRLDASIQANVTYKVRCWVEVPFNDGKQVEGKYIWGVKPSGETIQEAVASGHLYLLDPWYDTSWTYRETITIDNTQVDGDLEYFPVYIDDHDLSATFWAQVQNDGEDIVITSDDRATKLRRELVSIDTVGETMELHVRVPALSGDEDTILYIYYGNAGATEVNSTDTWDSNFVFVSHMNDDPDNAHIYDSTSNNNDGAKKAANEPVEVAGLVGKAQSFDGDDYIEIPSSASLSVDYITMEAYVDDSITVSAILHKAQGANFTGDYTLIRDVANTIQSGIRIGGTNIVNSSRMLPGQIYIAATYDGADLINYKDGSWVETETNPLGVMTKTGDSLWIGVRDRGGSGKDLYYTDPISEIRISNIARSEDWIGTTSNTLKTPAAFYSVAGAVTLTAPTMGSPSNPAVDGTSATISGSITDTGYPDAEDTCEYGFVWDDETHADPGDVAPDATDYDFYWTSTEEIGVSTFTHLITGLTPLTTYCFRAYALSSEYTYSDEMCFFAFPAGSVYLEIRPDLDETFIRGQAGIPTDANVGEFNGYSLPIWNSDYEELHYIMCVPDRWDGESDILLHVDSALALGNQADRSYRWLLIWEHFSPNEEVVPATGNNVYKERYIYSDAQYESYQDWLVIDYDIDVDDVIVVDDLIALTLRRITVAPNETDSDEIIVFAIDMLFARGDFLADPEGNTDIYITNFAALTGWIGDADMVFFTLVFLCLGLMIAGYALHKSSLAFLAISAWMALLVYCRIESGGEWGIYMAVFWLCFAGIVVCGIEGVFLNKGEEKADDEASFDNSIDQALTDMDVTMEDHRKNRGLFK